jgi:hypothetical protein
VRGEGDQPWRVVLLGELFLVLFQRRFGIVTRPEVVDLATELLGPVAGRMSGEWELRIRLVRVLGLGGIGGASRMRRSYADISSP